MRATQSQDPASEREPQFRPDWKHRLRRWWKNSGIRAGFWRVSDGLYNLWHPKTRVSSRGSYGRRRVALPVFIWRALSGGIRNFAIFRFFSRIADAMYDWWYPPVSVSESSGHYGRRRRGRLELGWRWMARTLARSWFFQTFGAAKHRFNEWWYPPVRDRRGGHYGRNRSSRAALAWMAFSVWFKDLWLVRKFHAARYAAYDWWFPPLQPGDLQGTRYRYARVSRPVRAYRRWNRWFKRTWVGKEFGWVIDQVADAGGFVRDQIVRELQWRRMRRWVLRPITAVIAGVLVVGLGAAQLYGRPAYNRYLETQYTAQARQFLENKDFSRAYLRAQQALRINQENGHAIGVVAHLAEMANSPHALYWRNRAAAVNPAISNKLALAAVALRLEPFPFPTASQVINEMRSTAAGNPSYHLSAGALALRLGKADDARKHYARAVELEPTNAVARMSLAVLQLQSADSKLIEDSRVTLQLLSAEGALGILPLRTMVAESAGRGQFKVAEELSSQLITNAGATVADRMLHLSILKLGGSSNLNACLLETQQFSTNHPALVGQTAAWMNQNGMAREAREWIGGLGTPSRETPLLRLAVADSFVAAQDWQGLREMLEQEKWAGLDYVRVGMLALAIRQSGDAPGGRLAWERALTLASDSPVALQTLGQLTAKWGWEEETEGLLWQAVTRLKTQTWPLEALQRLYLGRKDARALLRIAEFIARRKPNDLEARNNVAMLSLLLGRNLDHAHKTAAELHGAKRSNVTFASTYALSLHLQGRTSEGLEVLREVPPEELEQPALGAYYGMLLAASGEKESARKYLENSSKGFLLPEEMALVNAALKTL